MVLKRRLSHFGGSLGWSEESAAEIKRVVMTGRLCEVVRMGSAFAKPAARQALWDLCD
jgi:hypothetical protein